ncbi:bacterio-opsin activator domain-containing protein [Halorubrum sp. DTA46]|uniref:bacterio-opsin activator domain-containing protein n=1 Tax=Halorubrum sp. DTA46 TaxID=3402162 RepID=UPI003AB057F1
MDLTNATHRVAVGQFLAEAEVGFLYADSSHVIVDANEAVAELLGTSGDPTGRNVQAIDPSVDSELRNAIEDAVQSGRFTEKEIAADDGTILRFHVVPDQGGDGTGVLVRNVTKPFEMRHNLRRSNRILETLEDGVYTLDEAFVITSVNDAVTEMTGYDRDALVGSHASMLAGSETLEKAEEILAMLRGDSDDIGMIESSITTVDGESLPIETHFSPVEFDNGRRERVGVVRDISDRERNERILRELNRSARRLLRADDAESVFETVVDVTSTVWPEATVVAYSFDRTESKLVPTAASAGDHDACGPGTLVWKAFTTGEDGAEMAIDPARKAETETARKAEAETDSSTESFRAVDTPEENGPLGGEDAVSPTGRVIERSSDASDPDRRTLYATLDGYGLFRIEFDDDEHAENIEEPVELLAANAVAALDGVERENKLARNRERLERLDDLNTLLRRINGELVAAETLESIATAVCDTLIDADPVEFVWIGETYRTGAGPTPVARAGDSDGYLDERYGENAGDERSDERSDEAGGDPAIRATETKDTVRISDVSDGLRRDQWRERALARGYRSVVSVALTYDDLCYGVLSVYADQRSVFDGEFGDLIAELGDNVANAINSLETRRSLQSDSLVELELRLDGADTPLSRIASALGEPLHVEGTVPQGDGRSLVYFTADGDRSTVAESVGTAESVGVATSVRTVDGGPDGRFEASVTGETVADRLATYGGVVDRWVVDPERIAVTVTFPRSVDVRQIVEHLEAQYGHAELRSRRDRTEGDRFEPSQPVLAELTGRQREAIETAYLGGYFDWPRGSTGEEVATAMGITQPTFNRHLRTAERKLLETVLDERDSDA